MAASGSGTKPEAEPAPVPEGYVGSFMWRDLTLSFSFGFCLIWMCCELGVGWI